MTRRADCAAMTKPNPAQLDLARRLFAEESRGASLAGERVATAERVMGKIFARLSSLVGSGGARALFARSVRLAAAEFPFLERVDFDGEATLAEPRLRLLDGETPAKVAASMEAVCATLIALLETLIGAGLTLQVIRAAWPGIDVAPGEETER